MKKLIALLLAVCLLSGCTLATGESGDGFPQDHELVGFLLTVSVQEGEGYRDIWDEEAAGMISIGDHRMVGEKLYAQRIEEDGVVRYEFPEGCGLSCFCFYVFSDEEGESYRSNTTDPEFGDVLRHTYINSGTTNYMEATVYGTEDSQAMVQLNPVYQTPEGEVYALGTAPMSFDVGSMYGCATSVDQKATLNMGGETITGSSVKLNIQRAVLPERYVVLEMSAENEVLKQTEFAPGEMPESYAPGADAAYVILEAQDGVDTVRYIYSPADDVAVMDTFHPGEYGLCIKGYTRIEWEGAQ